MSGSPTGGAAETCPETATWQWDPPHTTNRQQFVNLPAAWDPPNNGRTIDLRGHVTPRQAGVTVTFNLVPNAANEAGTPAASLSTLTTTSGANGEAGVRLTLPIYGGARFSVGGRTPGMASPAISGELTVWRKVFYHITEMESTVSAVWSCGERSCPGHEGRRDCCERGVWHCNRTQPPCPGHSERSHRCAEGTSWTCGARDCPGHSQPFHKCRERGAVRPVWHCSIRSPACPGHSSHRHHCDPAPNLSFAAPAGMVTELQASFDPVFIKFAPGTTYHGTTPYRAHLTYEQRTALENSLRPEVQDNRSPFKMNIVLCDKADIVAEQEWSNGATSAQVRTPPFQEWPHQATVIRAQYQSSTGAWSDLADVHTERDPAHSDQICVVATIPGFAAGATVNVRIGYRYQRGNAGGWGGTMGTLFMCIGRDRRANPATPTGADLQQALTHETGHALGLVPNAASWRDTDPRDAPYDLKHCGYLTTGAIPEPRCVMWYMLGGAGARLRFCSSDAPNDCGHFLLRTDYSTIAWI